MRLIIKTRLRHAATLLLAICGGILSAQPAEPPEAYGRRLYHRIMQLNPDSLLRVHTNASVYEKSIDPENGCDSVYSKDQKKWYYIDRNQFYGIIAAGPSYDTWDYICATYNGYFYHNPREKLLQEADRMEQAAKNYPGNGEALINEAVHLRVWHNNLGRDSTVWIAEKQAAIKALERKGATWWALRTKWNLFSLTAGFGTSYPVAFSTAEELIRDIEGLDRKQYPFVGALYADIGTLYYQFRDYETAIPLLEKATREEPGLYFDRSNLRARNTLGIYHRSMGNRKCSDNYFLSILQSPDTIYSRAVHDAIALANLARSLGASGVCREAIALYELCLPIMIRENDYSFCSGIAAGMAECYVSLGDWEKAKQWADASLAYVRENIHYVNPHRARQIYPILAKYHQAKGNISTAGKYIDSLSLAHADYRNEFDAMQLMRTKQELLAERNHAQQTKLHTQQAGIIVLVVFALIAVLFSILIYYLYYKKKAAYRELVEKNKRWADSDRLEQNNRNNSEENPQIIHQPTEKDIEITARIHKMMLEENIYRNSDISLDTLAHQLKVTRETVSRSINRTTGKNFSRFLNEYRVKEAVRILSAARNHTVNFDQLAEEVGFNSRITFHRAFKQITGLPPAEFKNNG